MARDVKDIAADEFARLRGLLSARGIGEASCAFGDVWAAVSEWMLTGSDDVIDEAFLLGWECSWNPNDRHGDHDHPDPPEGVPEGPLFKLIFLRDFPGFGEVGVELWYPADEAWEPATQDPDWDRDHPINLHGWGYPGPRATEFLAVVGASPQIGIAARKTPALLRVFSSGSPDFVVRCA